MYAIVDIAGFQFNVESGKKLYVHRLEGEEGSQKSFDKVLLLGSDDEVKVGTPTVEGAVVNATILKHVKGDKVIVFKKKRRKGYQKKNGHRQLLTQIQIDVIAWNEVAATYNEVSEEVPVAYNEVLDEAATVYNEVPDEVSTVYNEISDEVSTVEVSDEVSTDEVSAEVATDDVSESNEPEAQPDENEITNTETENL